MDGVSDHGPYPLMVGGTVSVHRDLDLIQASADKIKAVALYRPLFLAVDGLVSYVTAFRHSFRTAVTRWPHKKGRPKVQVGQEMVERLIHQTQGQGMINTAFNERLNATFRQRFNSLARRTRTLVRKVDTLEAGMFIIGCLYNFCDPHHSLRIKLSVGRYGHHWVQRTPAIASGLADHIWSPAELFTFKVPLPRWVPPKLRGRRSQRTLKLIVRWCF